MTTEKRIHLNPHTGESSLCRAKTPQDCKFYSVASGVPEHYHTHQQARQAFENMMESQGALHHTVSTTTPAATPLIPEHGVAHDVTHDEVLEILDHEKIPEKKLLGYMLGGSFMRNLDTPESDRDVWIYTSDLSRTSKSVSSASEDDDHSIYTISDVLEAPRGHFEQLEGKLIHLNNNNPAVHLLRNLRPSYYEAIRSQRGNMKTNIATSAKNESIYPRTIKFAKRALVARYVEQSIIDSLYSKAPYNPRLSEEKRTQFYQELHDISQALQEIHTDRHATERYLTHRLLRE